jgi:RNA polymerase sigma factor (TIGR02999 family)
MVDTGGEITTLLEAIRAGDEQARTALVERMYDRLHAAAERLMRGERSDHTLQPTALLHEALARLMNGAAFTTAPNRLYLLQAATRAMRQVLVDHARHRNAACHGGGMQRLPLHRMALDSALASFEERHLDVEALHNALDRLATLHERQSQVIALRFFGGLSVDAVAEHLQVSISTVESDFRLARAWLRRELKREL